MFDHLAKTPVTVQSQANTLFVSLELSKSRWLVTVSAPGSAKFSKYSITDGDAAALLQLLERLQVAVAQRLGAPVAIAVITEAGLNGFGLHRLLCQHGVTSYIVDPASIAVPRRHRRAKTDKIDGEALLRTLIAMRGEQRGCAMVVPPSSEAEDQRRLSRERARLIKERIQHSNRIQGLLFGHDEQQAAQPRDLLPEVSPAARSAVAPPQAHPSASLGTHVSKRPKAMERASNRHLGGR